MDKSFRKNKNIDRKEVLVVNDKKKLEIKWEMNMSYPHSAPLCTYVLIMT